MQDGYVRIFTKRTHYAAYVAANEVRPILMTSWLTSPIGELVSCVRVVMLARLMEWASTISSHHFFDRLYRIISTGIRKSGFFSYSVRVFDLSLSALPELHSYLPIHAAMATGAIQETPGVCFQEFAAKMTSLAAVGATSVV